MTTSGSMRSMPIASVANSTELSPGRAVATCSFQASIESQRRTAPTTSTTTATTTAPAHTPSGTRTSNIAVRRAATTTASTR